MTATHMMVVATEEKRVCWKLMLNTKPAGSACN